MANRKKDNSNKSPNQVTERLDAVEKQIVEIIEEQYNPHPTRYEIETIKQHKRQNRLTSAIVGVAIVQFLVYCGLWYQAHRQNEISDSTNANTRQSIELAESNFIIENRAWVGVQYSQISAYDLQVIIKNFGKTPAENVRIGDTAFICNKIPSNRPQVMLDKPTAISPDAPKDIFISPKFFNNIVPQNILDGKTGICYYGIVTYTDIYNRIDTTEFMFFSKSMANLQRIGINRMK